MNNKRLIDSAIDAESNDNWVWAAILYRRAKCIKEAEICEGIAQLIAENTIPERFEK